ncbi:MAG TPA: hypothetical protein VFQ48_02390 [Pseudonocardiaceae bacterium]|nr:hypothetical protein [Pseudonocardiaceae bacterium]
MRRVQTRAGRFLDEPRRWSAIQLIGSKLFLLQRGAEVAAHLWRLLGALRG